jgi:cysteinyl-tRNA synthetase
MTELRLHDTMAREKRIFTPGDPRRVTLYVCGPTVYNRAHIGNARPAVVFDLLARLLRHIHGADSLVYARNVTDVDDKIIDAARSEGVDPSVITDRYETVWYDAMDAIGVLRPDQDPHATAYVERMVELIGQLVDAGIAYETSDGVYFACEKVAGYGLLARQSLDSLRAGARVETNDEKRSSVDFALWKRAEPGAPAVWPSPWGDGRPGWHTECVVMSLDLLGDGFDIHGGGQDLAFPHHENERAQAVALGHKFATHWVHNGFVEVEGEKMSKSLGNFTDLFDLVEWGDPRAYRLLVLQSHYRAPIEVSRETVAVAGKTLEGLDRFAREFASQVAGVEPERATMERFRSRMDDDLDSPAAIAAMFDALRRANRDGDLAAAAAVFSIAAAVGLELRSDIGEVSEEARRKAAERDGARAAKDWARADALRDELVAMGYEVTDTPDGTSLRPL